MTTPTARALRPAILPTESGACLIRAETGTWDAAGRPLANLADPVEPGDAATKAYVDALTTAGGGATVEDVEALEARVAALEAAAPGVKKRAGGK